MGSSLSSSSTWILSLKFLLIAAGVVSMAMAVPLLLNFAVYDLPAIWSVFHSCLKPLYLYVVINVIIITIAATSRFHRHNNHENQSHEPFVNPTTSNLLEVPVQPSFGILELPVVVCETEPRAFQEPQPPVVDVETVPMNDLEVVRVENEEDFVISRLTWNPPQQIINSPPPPENNRSEFILPAREKPLVTSRFAHQKQIKSSPVGGRTLRVAKPKKHETLESTWKTITDGGHMPLTRHLRKSDTFENHRQLDVYQREQAEAAGGKRKKKVVNKAETFKDRTNYDNQNHRPPPQPSSTNSSPASGGKLRKEGSLSQDELNRRVEAFIKKFNDEMRLQRQESMEQYKAMINRGSH